MSITLPFVDLSSMVVGATGNVDLQPSGIVSVPGPHPPILQIYNDSGAGLLITLKVSQLQFYLPPKGHSMVAISNKEGQLSYAVVNVSTNIQVNQLWTVYFYPNEEVSNFSPLGTSSVSQQATTLLNVGNPFGQKIIFAQPIGDGGVTGATVITNSGQITLGDAFVGNGHLSIVGPTLQDTQIDAGSFIMHDLLGNIAMSLQAVSPTSFNGSVSGTLSFIMPFQGTDFKAVLIFFNNFQDASTRNFALPIAFTQYFYMVTSSVGVAANGGIQVLSGVTVENIEVITGLAAATGTAVGQNTIFAYSLGARSGLGATPIDHVQVLSSTSAHSAIAILVGA